MRNYFLSIQNVIRPPDERRHPPQVAKSPSDKFLIFTT